MSISTGFVALTAGVLGAFAGVWLAGRVEGEPVAPNHARLVAKPGATLDLVDKEGVVIAKVILHTITHSGGGGTSARFEDYFQWRERITYRG